LNGKPSDADCINSGSVLYSGSKLSSTR